MKVLVETTGSFQLQLSETGELVGHVGFTVVRPTSFLQSRVLIGQVRVIAELSDDATQAEWLKYVSECDGDTELAVESFKSAFPVNGVKPEPVEAKKGRPSKKAD